MRSGDSLYRMSRLFSASTASSGQVWVLDANNVAKEVAVKVGISDGQMTEITGGDLNVGMQVITDQKVVTSD